MIGSANGRRRFTLDTNILVYSINMSESAKHATAIAIVDRAVDADCVLTLQSISEFYYATTRKYLMAPSRAAELAEKWLALFPLAGVSTSAIRVALPNAVAGRASYWDALLVATAAEAGCSVILSEDMADGSLIGGVQIHNPFERGRGMTELTRQLLGL
ncbi:MAG: PIN domain-containing protein [Alphaproteobacteria bacterium]|nr:PIN domain-containing protein [Alphaproteobacteria bacterium]